MKTGIFAAAIGLVLAAGALAQTAPPTRLRGTIGGLDGLTLTIVTREGPSVKIMLDEKYTVAAPRKLTLADIKPKPAEPEPISLE